MSKILQLVRIEHSKPQVTRILRYIGNDKKRFGQLIELMLTGDPETRRRASWPVSYVSELHPDWILPYLKKVLRHLERPDLHVAEKRNITRLLQWTDIPATLQGPALKLLFPLLTSSSESIAARVFSMTALARICQSHPELARELKMVIEAGIEHGSAGYKSRAKKTLKKLAAKR